MRISGESRVIGFVGSTFAKSRIYGIYNSAFEALDLDCVYVPFRVTDIGGALRGMRALGIHGFGVTIPFKVSAMEHVDSIDESARRSGAVNVVINRDGELFGSNTDGLGAVKAVEEVTPVAGRRICLIGSGGAARAIAVECVLAGATVDILSIDAAEAAAMAAHTGGVAHPWETLADRVAGADIIIHATPVGTSGTAMADQTLVPGELLREGQVVMDVITTPSETRLLREARERGLGTVRGERMLVWQALLKFRLFTGRDITIDALEAALRSG